jgi:hypothetical protein
MIGIAVELGRPPVISRRHHRLGEAFEGERRGVMLGDPRRHGLRLANIGTREVRRSVAAAAEPAEQQRGAHQLEELAPALRGVDEGDREFRRQRCREALGVGKLFQRRPELPAPAARKATARGGDVERVRLRIHRWHTKQWVISPMRMP